MEIKQRQSARGFSLYVCLTLIVANTLRIMFWCISLYLAFTRLCRFGKHFEWQLLVQSIIMIIAMWILIHVSVTLTRRHILPPYKGVSVWSESAAVLRMS